MPADRTETTVLALVAIVACAALIYALLALRRARAIDRENAGALPPQMFSLAVPLSALLPSGVPIVDGVRLSASHVPGDGIAGGGDFYDAFFLDDDTIALAVGDVTGGTLSAVVAMNVVRQAVRNAFLAGASPADVLRHANRVLLRSGSDAVATAVVATLDPATLALCYAGAGHPAPMLATGDGPAIELPLPRTSLALGVVPHHVTADERTTMPTGSMLLLYTGGLVSGGDAAAGTRVLADVAAAALALDPAAQAAPAIDRAILGDRPRREDATVLTAFAEPTLEHVDTRFPAEAGSAASARVALRRFFAASALGDRRTYDALVAIGEAVSNAIEHAYVDRPNQSFALRARYEGATAVVCVEDTGTWRGTGEPDGRGITLMRQLSDDCTIECTPNGTTVTLRFALAPRLADAALGVGHR